MLNGIDKKLISFVLLAVFTLSGCAIHPQGVGLDTATPSNTRIEKTVWLKPAEINSSSLKENRSTAETAMTLSLLKYIEEKKIFTRAQVLPGTIAGDEHILQFRFDKFTVERNAHPAYFPLAIITLTVYIWANGPIYIDTIDIDGTLIVTDAEGHEVAAFKHAVREEKKVGYSDPDYFASSGIQQRTQVVSKLLEQYENFLGQQNAKKGSI